MTTFLFVVVLAMLGFLCFTSSGGFMGPGHRR